MALPANAAPWPPEPLAPILDKLAEYSNRYANEPVIVAKPRPGMMQRVRQWWNGDPTKQPEEHLHVPLAQEICRTSANLLFGEPATATIETDSDAERVQERLDLIAGPALEQTIINAAEISAALGGVYLRAVWDKTTHENAFVDKVDADMASPEFRWGKLIAVTFWRTVHTENATVWRHLERHELDALGIGVVYHGLYEGAADNLGHIVPLQDRPETAGIEVDADGKISTGTPGLAVAYAPNIAPSALWRKHPVGANLGRSDLEGIEPMLDALDELYTSWMRDIRLGKARLVVGESLLRDLGAGEGSGFDLDQQIFTPVKVPPGSNKEAGLQLEAVQFDIRTEDFTKAIDHFRRIILEAAGYSPATFGMDTEGGAVTATEIVARQSASFATRRRKILGLKPALEHILEKALAMDAVVFPNMGAQALPVSVQFPDGVQDDPEAIARQNQLDAASQSASIETRVRRAHPDWDDPEVQKEVARIQAEAGGAESPDPDDVGRGGEGLGDSFGEPVGDES